MKTIILTTTEGSQIPAIYCELNKMQEAQQAAAVTGLTLWTFTFNDDDSMQATRGEHFVNREAYLLIDESGNAPEFDDGFFEIASYSSIIRDTSEADDDDELNREELILTKTDEEGDAGQAIASDECGEQWHELFYEPQDMPDTSELPVCFRCHKHSADGYEYKGSNPTGNRFICADCVTFTN